FRTSSSITTARSEIWEDSRPLRKPAASGAMESTSGCSASACDWPFSAEFLVSSRSPEQIAKSFRATLERTRSRLNWVIARIPFDVSKIWETRGQIKVKGDINGFAFRTSLFPTGDGHHVLLVNKRMQTGGKVTLGGVAKFRLEPD